MPRRRRSPQEAREEILDAAADLLAHGGLAAVQVRAVAARVGMTDAGVGHHVGTRDELLAELLRHGGRRVVETIAAAIDEWQRDEGSLESLIAALGDIYRSGYAELAVSLYQAGWRSRRDGLLEPVVGAVHARRRDPDASVDDTRLALAALHQAIALEPLFGAEFRRSTGATAGTDEVYRWWADALRASLGLE